ncbi:glycosyltransferase family 2 protein [Aureimonas populi]|uniref:Glycosyltransferase family 2 protein n=2 Tax=Aureimonas populi TaxID=1701758 RepID=A0ABW5CG44_9HYPH
MYRVPPSSAPKAEAASFPYDRTPGHAKREPAEGALAAVLRALDLPAHEVAVARERGRMNGSDLSAELLAGGLTSEERLADAVARVLGLPRGRPGPDDTILDMRAAHPRQRFVKTCTAQLRPRVFLAPPLDGLDALAGRLRERRSRPEHLFVATLADIRAHGAQASEAQRLREAVDRLSTASPTLSARSTLSAGQAFFGGILLCVLLFSAMRFGYGLWALSHAALGLFFAAWTLFRLHILIDRPRERRRRQADERLRDETLSLPVGPMPIYTVLVALYQEEEMAEPLVRSLAALNWPASRLDVKLICEADDATTIAAVERAMSGRAGFELVRVPAGGPRTKPKALNHALPLARGDYVVLYDAEDRPDPDQLLEAWYVFCASPPELACLQAPLVIRNGADGWFARLFALEYAVLFRATHPYLARRGLPIPLGGTSNHFRRQALEAVGAWDSHNVAEDADLGIRLSRRGFHTGTIHAPTSEIAPLRWRDWRNQRTRWIKGWCQTWLVHMRQPVRLWQELGPRRFATFQLLFLSMVGGGVMHTIFVGAVLVEVAALLAGHPAFLGLGGWAILDLFNICAALAVFGLLAASVVTRQERRTLLPGLWTLWAYWLLLSLACLRAVTHLVTNPSGWEKTPHNEAGDARAE